MVRPSALASSCNDFSLSRLRPESTCGVTCGVTAGLGLDSFWINWPPSWRNRVWQTGLFATGDHVEDAAAGFFSVASQEHRVGDERIAGDGSVRRAKRLGCEWKRKFSGIPDFKPVGEEHDLHAGVAGVIAGGDGVDNGLGNGFAREFIFDRRLRPKRARADCTAGDFGHHEVNGLVHEFKNRAFVNLVRRNGLANLRTVEVHALNFGSEQEALGLAAKKDEDGGVSRLAGVEQVEMGQRLGWWGIFAERVLPLATKQCRETILLCLPQCSARVASGQAAASKGRMRSRPVRSRCSTRLA